MPFEQANKILNVHDSQHEWSLSLRTLSEVAEYESYVKNKDVVQ